MLPLVASYSKATSSAEMEGVGVPPASSYVTEIFDKYIALESDEPVIVVHDEVDIDDDDEEDTRFDGMDDE